MIIYDTDILRKPVLDIPLKEEEKELSSQLFKFILDYKTINCVSANQIGINKNIAAFNIIGRAPFYLINPKLLDSDLVVKYIEDDISFPNKIFKTYRYARIFVSADNLIKPMWFGSVSKIEPATSPIIIETVAIQHMIDSLNGVLITERETPISSKNLKITKDQKFGRNNIILLEKDEIKLEVKFKRIQKFLSEGWKICKN